jgi:hypothetical protein
VHARRIEGHGHERAVGQRIDQVAVREGEGADARNAETYAVAIGQAVGHERSLTLTPHGAFVNHHARVTQHERTTLAPLPPGRVHGHRQGRVPPHGAHPVDAIGARGTAERLEQDLVIGRPTERRGSSAKVRDCGDVSAAHPDFAED